MTFLPQPSGPSWMDNLPSWIQPTAPGAGQWTNPDGPGPIPQRVGGLFGGQGISPAAAQMLGQYFSKIGSQAMNVPGGGAPGWAGIAASILGNTLGVHYGTAAAEADRDKTDNTTQAKNQALQAILKGGLYGMDQDKSGALAAAAQSGALTPDQIMGLARLMRDPYAGQKKGGGGSGGGGTGAPKMYWDEEGKIYRWDAPNRPSLNGKPAKLGGDGGWLNSTEDTGDGEQADSGGSWWSNLFSGGDEPKAEAEPSDPAAETMARALKPGQAPSRLGGYGAAQDEFTQGALSPGAPAPKRDADRPDPLAQAPAQPVIAPAADPAAEAMARALPAGQAPSRLGGYPAAQDEFRQSQRAPAAQASEREADKPKRVRMRLVAQEPRQQRPQRGGNRSRGSATPAPLTPDQQLDISAMRNAPEGTVFEVGSGGARWKISGGRLVRAD